MFGSTILDACIGLVAAYLGLSLVCSALNELISAFTRARARELKRGIGQMLTNTNNWSVLFFDHQLVKAFSNGRHKPSYIPSQTFVRVPLHLVNDKAAAATPPIGGRG
jgi:hypothetical protein